MTTLKPQLVRADTLDLQAHDAPSAKDHTRQPAHPAPYGFGPAAPHQTQALRSAERDAHLQQSRSPRVSDERNGGPFPEEPNFYDEPDDEYDSEHAEGPNGTNGTNQDEHDMEEGDQGDDDMDDDMLDKISSSPSIDDGKHTLPIWPPRSSSVASGDTRSPLSTPTRGSSQAHSSSPFTSTPDYLPLHVKRSPEHKPASHHHGEYGRTPPDKSPTRSTSLPPTGSVGLNHDVWYEADEEPDQGSSETADINMYLLPEDDPLLDNSFDDTSYEVHENEAEDEWEDDDEAVYLDDEISSSDDDSCDFTWTTDPRFIDSGWGGECLRETEDIDFEFVYALHTFVATVEGQANATKGDTMVLLDDSNSYWWLVRVVKDGTIGYLPAEHIETPTERLARLNKHRNIDLSATMLGDNPEKSKNPLKKAMKRRNQKTVQFAPPTYYEPSEYEGSEDEEDEEDSSELVENTNAVHAQDAQSKEKAEVAAATAAGAAVAAGSLAIMTDTHEPRQLTNGIKRITSDESLNSDTQTSPEKMKSADHVLANGDSDTSLNVSRKGNVRNTDSFFKDDNVETKKISLTPRLLRGDSELNTAPEQQDLKQRPSLETFDKMLGADEKSSKEDKKKKEKKGMLRGLFGRKEKAPKGGATSDTDEPSKVSEESLRFSPQSKDSLESVSSKTEPSAPERKPSKLQKTPPNLLSPKSSPVEGRTAFSNNAPPSQQEPNAPLVPAGPAPLPPTSRPVDNQPRNAPSLALNTSGSVSRDSRTNNVASPVEKKSMFSPITNVLRSTPSTSHIEDASVSKPAYAKVAKNRFAIDDGESDDDSTPTAEHQDHRSISPLRDSQQLAVLDRDSPRQVSPVERSDEREFVPPRQSPPALVVDTYSNRPTPMVEAPGAFPETPMETPMDEDTQMPGSDRTTSSIKDSPATDIPTPSSSRTTPTWSDASLRSYMDNDQDIRDLLIIVHDRSNVQPAGPDHPYVSNLFVNERSKLAEMQATLDSMLTGWISRKNQSLLSR